MRCAALLSLLSIIGLHANSAQAQIVFSDLILQIEQDGRGRLLNTTSGSVGFDGYSITDNPGARLRPENYTSIEDAVAMDAVAVIAKLGSGALAFGEVPTIGPSLIAELNLAGVAVLQPGDSWELGPAFPPNLPIGFNPPGLAFALSGGGVVINPDPNTVFIQVIPEPSACVLAAMASLSLAICAAQRRSRLTICRNLAKN